MFINQARIDLRVNILWAVVLPFPSPIAALPVEMLAALFPDSLEIRVLVASIVAHQFITFFAFLVRLFPFLLINKFYIKTLELFLYFSFEIPVSANFWSKGHCLFYFLSTDLSFPAFWVYFSPGVDPKSKELNALFYILFWVSAKGMRSVLLIFCILAFLMTLRSYWVSEWRILLISCDMVRDVF